jgi:hypothetical protein
MAFQQYPQKLGVPSGTTAQRPSNPVTGDTYYDGTLGFLFIFDGTAFIPCSAPAAQPSITVADVGTNQPYAAPTALVTFTEGVSGGKAAGFTAIQSTFSATATSSPITLTIGGPGTSLAFNGTAYNGFGTSPQSLTVNQTITSVPQTPTIGTATAATSSNQVTVTWTNGATGGKNISAITITPYLNGTTAETSRTAATTSSTSYTFTEGQLTAASSYTFKVKATNANGDSLESSASNSATMPSLVLIDYLVVAGGGAGGSAYGGGGGAGGLRSSVTATGGGGTLENGIYISKNTNYTVTVGAGGAAGAAGYNPNNFGKQGNDSVFETITSTKGGGGSTGAATTIELNGGSGGGGSDNGNIGQGTANQGYNGGGSASAGNYGSGGGGGAGAVGSAGNTGAGGNGGTGVAVSITGSSVTYAGGGGGGTYQGGTAGTGGSGGGGNAGASGVSNPSNGNPGTANTGGGGGGSSADPYTRVGGTGGSGVVILRWLTSAATITVGAGLTADSTGTSGSYSYKRITAGTGNVSFS